MKISHVLASIAIFVFCVSVACGQGRNLQGTDQNPTEQKTSRKHKGLLGLVPTYDVIDVKHARPLTPGEKFRMAVQDSANPFEFAEAAVKAEYYRGTNPRKKIGHGGVGYLKQFGASYLDEVSGNMFGTFFYPSLLHQDPRYFRKGEGPIASRLAYALSRVFITRSDGGRRQFNASRVLGSASSTILSNTYYPPRARGVGITVGNIGWALLGNGASDIFKEFWPDIAQRLARNH